MKINQPVKISKASATMLPATPKTQNGTPLDPKNMGGRVGFLPEPDGVDVGFFPGVWVGPETG